MRYALKSSTGHEPQYVYAIATSISAGGLSFVSPVSISIKTELIIELELPGGDKGTRAAGRVVWIDDEQDRGTDIEYGVAFTSVDDPDELDRYVRSIDLRPLLETMVRERASSLHLSSGAEPLMRVNGSLTPAVARRFSAAQVENLVMGLLSPDRRRQLKQSRNLDFALAIPELGRWRVNVHFQRGHVEAVFNSVDLSIPTVESLGLPDSIRHLALSRSGLLIVTGPKGSGKTTTLAALIDTINHETSRVIVTIEDPVEYLHDNHRSIIRQREVGADAESFSDALQQAMRQDPNVIVLSDIRDAATLDLVLHAAETGYLVLAAMNTHDLRGTIERMATMYPRDLRDSVLQILSCNLLGIISQRLLPTVDGQGLALAAEVMINNEGMRQAIRSDNLDNLPVVVSMSRGSITLESSLRSLVVRGLVDMETAARWAPDADRFRRLISEHGNR